MMEQNSQQLDKHYQSLIDIQHEQLIALRKENHHLRGKIMHDKQRKLNKKEEYEDKLQNLQNDARIRLDEGSELIRKLQQHLKICQEKLSEQTKALLAKDDTICQYQLHIAHLDEIIRQLMDEYTAQNLQISLNLHENQKMDVAVQTSPTTSVLRRCVRFNLDKENCPIDPKYFQSTNK